MDAKVVAFYRQIFSDLTVSREESAELTDFLKSSINPPPDKLLWLRGTAFRIGCEFIDEEEGDKDNLIALLRAINCIVHAVETTCMQVKHADDEELEEDALPDAVPFDEEAVTEFYNAIFSDLSVDQEESQQLYDFFGTTNRPAAAEDLVAMRATAFKVACQHLSDDKETNVKLFKCVNFCVRAFERSCLEPKPFELLVWPVQQSEAADEAAAPAAAAAAFDLTVSLSDAVQKLWDLDDNRLDPQHDYRINVQSGKKPYWKEDKAEDPLFDYVDPSILKQRRTYQTFVALLDNYSAQTGVKEQVTAKERREINAFLKAVLETKPMQFCHLYCHAQNPDKVPADRGEFRQLLYKIWFELYHREHGKYDSSGFEHVFVGEIKDDKISGFHNWIQFYLQEKAGHLDYRGYIKPRSHNDARPDDHDQLLTLQFTWKGIEKSVGSSFIGVSPEFEFALYSMCFLVGDEANEIQLAAGGIENDYFDIVIKCYKMAYDKVGTSFPEIQSHFEDE